MPDAFATSVTVRAIGWALVQSIWQGAVIGAVTALALTALRRSAANVRYAAACCGLLLFAALTVVTGAMHARELRHAPLGDGLQTVPYVMIVPSMPPAGTRVVGDSLLDVPFTARERLEQWSVMAVPLWLLGVLVLCSRLVGSWFNVERIRRAAAWPVPEVWRSRAHVLAGQLRVMRPFQIVQSSIADVPMMIGWLRPVILLPGSALTGLSPAQLEAVIAHELAHIRRHDYLVNMLQMAVDTLLFYHPATWWISRQIRIEREHCCDDVVVGLCGDRVAYAHALVELEELRGAKPAFGMAATGAPLLRRIRRLLGLSATHEQHSLTWIVVGALLMALSITLVIEGASSAQTPDTSRSVQGDKGVVRGRIVEARSGRPVAEATVELAKQGQAKTALTDINGRYEVRGLEPGEYRLHVRANGYVPVEYGQRNRREDGTGIEVRGGQITTDANVGLEPAGVISGRVFTDAGEGLAGVEIELIAEGYLPTGGPRPIPTAWAQTEAFGVFRVGELPPGQYYVKAHVPRTVRPTRADQTHVYAPTYFSGATRINDAQPILLSAGQEFFDVDFALMAVTTHVVSGRLVDPGGPPLNQARVGLNFDVDQMVPVAADGRFQIRDVVPGDYELRVMERAPFGSRWLAATQQIRVDEDVSGVEVVARRGARVEGRIVRDDGEPFTFNPATLMVGAEVRPGGGVSFTIGGDPPGGDGTFSIETPGGVSYLQVLRLPPSWTVKAVRLEGLDITDQGVDFGEGVRRQVEIVLTDRITSIAGLVSDRSGRIVSNYAVVVFPENRDRWESPSRMIQSARPDTGGWYRIDVLPPGDYVAIAVDSLPRGALIDPKILERLWPLATPFRLREGDRQTVSLRLSATPDGLLP